MKERELIENTLAQALRYDPAPPDGVTLLRADELIAEPVSWLWAGWLPQGKLVLLAGAPGTGKTTLAMDMAATVSAGGYWPDSTRCPTGDVLIWSGEDDAADTLLPRLMAAGADLSRVRFVGDVREHGKARPFDPATDTQGLLQAASQLSDLRFILVDPVVSAVAGDSYKNAEVRRGLQPLVEFAAASQAVLLGITHYAKGGDGQDPTQRVLGSVAFTAVARVVLGVVKGEDEDGNERRVLARTKSNLGPDEGGFAYDLEQCEPAPNIWSSRVHWGKAMEGSARDLLVERPSEKAKDNSPRDKVVEFLRERLALGTCPVNKLYDEAAELGISRKKLRQVASEVGVHKQKGAMKAGWYWTWRQAQEDYRQCKDAEEAAEEAEESHPEKMGAFGIFGAFDGVLSGLVVQGQSVSEPAELRAP